MKTAAVKQQDPTPPDPANDPDQDPDDVEETQDAGDDFDEDDLVDDIQEIPIHGVAAVTGSPTGDGRMFATGGLTTRELPLPARFEYVGSHGGNDTSMVATVGRIDEMWMEGAEMRFRGVLLMDAQYTPDVVGGIIDGRYRSLSVEVDDVSIDVSEQRAEMKEQLLEEQKRQQEASEVKVGDDGDLEVEAPEPMTDEEIDEILDTWIGDGTMPLTTFATARICGFTIVPIGAFSEAYVALGHEFPDELSNEAKDALVACGCGSPTAEQIEEQNAAVADFFADILNARVVDTSSLTEEERAAYYLMSEDEQIAYELEHGLTASATFAPGTHDGPGWITNPRATARIRKYWVRGKGAAKIRWGEPGDFNRCRKQLAKYVQNPDWLAGLCANMHKEAIGVWPGQEGGGNGHHSVQGLTAAASVTFEEIRKNGISASMFENPGLTEPTQLTIGEDGRIFGHLAEWGICHIGIQGLCQEAPPSYSNYAYFLTGTIDTDDGPVHVGNLTQGIGHAGRWDSAAQATAHYDQIDSVFAHVAIGEDAVGIWFSGIPASGVTEEDLIRVKAIGALSGDWREVRGALELVGAVSVTTPGLPVRAQLAASGGHQISLVAAGVIQSATVAQSDEELRFTPENVAAIARTSVQEYIHTQERAVRIETVRGKSTKLRALRIQKAKAKLATLGKGQNDGV